MCHSTPLLLFIIRTLNSLVDGICRNPQIFFGNYVWNPQIFSRKSVWNPQILREQKYESIEIYPRRNLH